MIPHRFIPFASALSVFSQVCGAQTITLTTHVSACSATYTSGTSTTVIQSTVTVQPTPWTDTVANSGAPFVIRLEQTDISGYPDQDGAAPYWLTANGNTTTNSSLAAVYFINEGRMSLLNGSHIAANFNVVDQAFGVTNYPMPINTTFSVRNRMLNWTNPLFSNGTAQFYKLPPGLLDNALILAKFLGPMEAQRSWSPVVLWVEPRNGTSMVSTSTSSGSSAAPLSTVSDLLPSSAPSATGGAALSGSASSSVSSGTVAQSSISGSSASSSAAVVASSIASQLSSQLSSVASVASSVSPMDSMSSASPSARSSASSSAMSSAPSSDMSSAGASSSLVVSSDAQSSSSSSALASSSTTPPMVSSAVEVSSVPMSSSQMHSMALSSAVSSILPPVVSFASSSPSLATSSIEALTTSMTNSPTSSSASSSMISMASSSTVPVVNSVATSSLSPIVPIPVSSSPAGGVSSSSPADVSTATSIPLSSSVSISGIGPVIVPSSSSSSSSNLAPISSAVSSVVSSATAGSTSVAPDTSSSLAVSSVPATSSIDAVSSAPAISSSTPGSSFSSSSSVSSATPTLLPQTTYSCPVVDGQTVQANTGGFYDIGCDQDTTGGGQFAGSALDFNGCMTYCDNTPDCGAWTYTGDCYIKTTFPISGYEFQPASPGTVGGIRSAVVPGGSLGSPTSTPVSTPSVADSTSSSAPSAVISQTTYTCPEVDGQTVQDNLGNTYTIGCGKDTTGGGQYAGSSPDFNGCMTMCDRTNGCGSWSYNGACYLKTTFPISGYAFEDSGPNNVAGIRSELASGNPTSTFSSTTFTRTAPGSPFAATGTALPTCPDMDGASITDSNGAVYSVQCGGDSQGGLITNVGVNGRGIMECFEACDRTSGCTAFTYSGDSTMTQGTCYLKYEAGDISSSNTPTIALAILISPAPGSAASSVSSSAPVAASSTPAESSVAPPASSDGAASSSAPAAASSSSAPLPSGGAGTSVVNPDGSTSTYSGLLPSPTRCDFGDPLGTEEDDSYCEVDLPFNVQIYGRTDAKTFPSTNGYLSLIQGSSIYDNQYGLPNPYTPRVVAFAFFDDLIVMENNLDQGIFYQYTDTAVTYEWRLGRGGTYETYHFTVTYDSTNPGVFVYRYYEVGQEQGGLSADIGIQGLAADGTTQIAVQYAHHQQNGAEVGMTLTCDTAASPATCVRS